MCERERERGGERERERETDRQTDRQAGRQADRQTDRQKKKRRAKTTTPPPITNKNLLILTEQYKTVQIWGVDIPQATSGLTNGYTTSKRWEE